MKPGICFKKIWFDDDVVELKIDSFDGNSLFSTKVYVGHQSLVDLTAELSDFKNEVYGGIYDIKWARSDLNTLTVHFVPACIFPSTAKFI